MVFIVFCYNFIILCGWILIGSSLPPDKIYEAERFWTVLLTYPSIALMLADGAPSSSASRAVTMLVFAFLYCIGQLYLKFTHAAFITSYLK